MKLRLDHDQVDIDNIDYISERTTIRIMVQFKWNDEKYYVVNREISLYDAAEDGNNAVFYNAPEFIIDGANLNESTISKAVVAFLAHFKLYMYSYSIAGHKSYVSYNSSAQTTQLGLKFQPAYHDTNIFIEAIAQTEDGIDYNQIFDTRIKGAVKSISDEDLVRIGYSDDEDYIRNATLLKESEMPQELLKWTEFKA
jgi:hypothetical protein